MDRVFDAADPIAFRDRELDGVLAGIEARAARILKGARHAVHHRRQHGVDRPGLDALAVAIHDDVANHARSRSGVVAANLRANQQLHLALFRSTQRKRRDAKRQRRRQQRRGEAGRDGVAHRARPVQVGRHVQQLPSRPDRRAAPGDVDANRTRLAVAIGGIGFDAEQVVARELRFDVREQLAAGAVDEEQRAARGGGEHLQAVVAQVVRRLVDRRPGAGDVEQLAVELQRVDAGPRRGRQRAELGGQPAVAHRKALRHQDQRLRSVENLHRVEHVAQRPDRHVARAPQLIGQRHGFGVDFLPALLHRRRARPQPRALARVDRLGGQPVAVRDLERFARRDRLVRELDGLPLPGHAADRLFDALAVGDERRRRTADPQADGGDAIAGRQPIDEGAGGRQHRSGAAGPDMRLVDHDRNQPAAGRVLVRAVALGHARHRLRVGGLRRQRHPLGADHGSRLAVHADREIGRHQAQQRLALTVDDRDVDRGHLDRRSETWRLLLRLLRGRDGAEDGREGRAAPTVNHRARDRGARPRPELSVRSAISVVIVKWPSRAWCFIWPPMRGIPAAREPDTVRPPSP